MLEHNLHIRKAQKLGMLFLMAFVGVFSTKSLAQVQNSSENALLTISLEEILTIARINSLDVFKAKRQYEVNHWSFRSYKSSILPKVDLKIEPLNYNRSIVERYDSEQNIDVFRQQQVLSSYAYLSLNQKIRATGATVFINSSFDRIMNFGDEEYLNYIVSPIRIGFNQPLMAFNEFKWDHKTEPVKYSLAKKKYLNNLAQLQLKAFSLFFNWALDSNRVAIAKENNLSATKLFKIGKKRYEIGAIEKDDILNLELELFNSETNLTKLEKGLEKAEVDLMIFLRKNQWNYSAPKLPELISNLHIDISQANELAKINNPDLLNLKLKRIVGNRDLDRAIKENRFDLSLIASYGLNQQGGDIQDVYSSFLDQQMIAIQMNIPILDWGERKGNIKMAKTNKEVVNIEIQQEGEKLKQEISLKVTDFNLQEQLVLGDLRSKEISRESYEVTQKRFLSGSVDLLKLTSARKSWQAASETYIQSLYNYWKFYYEVQQLTLFDFINNKALEANFEKIVDN